jgi:hypothetical protein
MNPFPPFHSAPIPLVRASHTSPPSAIIMRSAGPPGAHPLNKTITVSVCHFLLRFMDQAMNDDDPSTGIRRRGSVATEYRGAQSPRSFHWTGFSPVQIEALSHLASASEFLQARTLRSQVSVVCRHLRRIGGHIAFPLAGIGLFRPVSASTVSYELRHTTRDVRRPGRDSFFHAEVYQWFVGFVGQRYRDRKTVTSGELLDSMQTNFGLSLAPHTFCHIVCNIGK